MAMNFFPGTLAESLSEMAGYKVGLALSLEELCDHLTGPGDLAEIVRASEDRVIRIRSEVYEAIHYRLLHRIGYTEDEMVGLPPGARAFHKYKAFPELLACHEAMHTIYLEMFTQMVQEAQARADKSIDIKAFVNRCKRELGLVGMKMALDHIKELANKLRASPFAQGRWVEWESPLELKLLFKGTAEAPEVGKFIDQRYLDYLSNNVHRIGEMHWRKFEELTAEYFEREGFRVEIGPGSNDDGVDVRLWKPEAPEASKPTCIVQCKRQKDKIEKVVVKGLAADVEYEGAEYGMIVTTSTLSPGAATTISARGYPIQAVERDAVIKWLQRLRTPGTGIVRV
ncbi:restriction endonuclease [Pseudomonas aeruginosa]|uniref:restriction endonuclease n=1 Tax=Pseudomonas aeruginosa TaxID=287 RepID=UPI00071B0DF9|nr:restriction endonuclease [Pseudomonas aeruginosa]KSQ21773.1 restriction endonuclease [Pseudomonas aeruginosa]RPV61447.1 restriction endonuclease [Pseudomonas aeruginosa]